MMTAIFLLQILLLGLMVYPLLKKKVQEFPTTPKLYSPPTETRKSRVVKRDENDQIIRNK